jgi:hypothetical protein
MANFEMMTRLFRLHRSLPRQLAVIAIAALIVLTVAAAASACPTCKDGLAQNDPHGQSVAAGYYYSILFMMAMPYALLTTLGTFAYRAVKKAQVKQADELAAAEPAIQP